MQIQEAYTYEDRKYGINIQTGVQKPNEMKLPPVIKDYIGNKATLEDLEQLKNLVAKRYAELKVPRLD